MIYGKKQLVLITAKIFKVGDYSKSASLKVYVTEITKRWTLYESRIRPYGSLDMRKKSLIPRVGKKPLYYRKSLESLLESARHDIVPRGASAPQSLSRTVINMFGDVSKGEVVNVECAKRKTDGGQNYRETFKLEPDRWFHHTLIVAPPKKRTAYQAIRSFMESVLYPNVKKTGEIIVEFEREFTDVSVRKAVSDLFRDAFLINPLAVTAGSPE